MKRLLILFSLAAVSIFAFTQIQNQTKAKNIFGEADEEDDEEDSLSEEYNRIDYALEGPHGETVYIGVNGGRYYFRNDKKIYGASKSRNRNS